MVNGDCALSGPNKVNGDSALSGSYMVIHVDDRLIVHSLAQNGDGATSQSGDGDGAQSRPKMVMVEKFGVSQITCIG